MGIFRDIIKPSVKTAELDALRTRLAKEREATRAARMDAIDKLAQNIIADLHSHSSRPEPKT